jgi:hypothetical protein
MVAISSAPEAGDAMTTVQVDAERVAARTARRRLAASRAAEAVCWWRDFVFALQSVPLNETGEISTRRPSHPPVWTTM